MNASVNVGCDCNVFKDVTKKKMYVYVSPCDSMLTLFSRDVYLCGYKCLNWGNDQQQDLGKPS